MYQLKFAPILLFALFVHIGTALNYGEKITVKATYHDYFPSTPENTVACQLPMKVINGVVRVTAANQAAGYDKSYGCGNCVKVTNKARGGKSLTLMIIDEKGAEGLDIARSAFNALDNDAKDGRAAGRMQVDVENVACGDLVGKLKYRFKAGSNQWWFAISIVDHNVPVKTVALSKSQNGPFYNCKRSPSINNYFDCNSIKRNLGGKFGLQMWIKLTGANGEQIVDHLTKITPEDSPLDSPLGKQFGSGGGGSTASSSKTTKGSTTTRRATTAKTTTKSSQPCGGKFKCPSNGFFGDPCDCHKYYQCHNGRAWSKSCNGVLVWDSAVQNCNFKHSTPNYPKNHCD